MASLMGMNRFMADAGMKGMGEAAQLQTQREGAKKSLEEAEKATMMSTTASMGASGAMLGFAAGGPVGAGVGFAAGALAGFLMSEFG